MGMSFVEILNPLNLKNDPYFKLLEMAKRINTSESTMGQVSLKMRWDEVTNFSKKLRVAHLFCMMVGWRLKLPKNEKEKKISMD